MYIHVYILYVYNSVVFADFLIKSSFKKKIDRYTCRYALLFFVDPFAYKHDQLVVVAVNSVDWPALNIAAHKKCYLR